VRTASRPARSTVTLRTTPSTGSAPPAGLYLTDTNSRKVFFAAASQFARYAGDLVVGTELKGELWVIRPRGNGFVTRELRTNLPAANYNLEGATYVSS
jgi:hypothetical protein